MLKNLIVLSDGTRLCSGAPGAAITSLQLTQCVNSKEELTLGSACAAMLEMKLLLPEGMGITAGEELTLYRVDDAEKAHRAGIFVAQKPERTGLYSWRLTAFDRMVYTDRDMTDWLAGLTGWPYTLQQLAGMVCDACGVTLAGEPLPNGDLPVQAFQAADITGRELLQWIGEASGRFCRMTGEGTLEFAWYTPASRLSLGPTFAWGIGSDCLEGALTVELTGSATADGVALEGESLSAVWEDGEVRLIGPERQYYYMGSLSRADDRIQPIQRVQIRANAQDIGTVWPPEEGEANTYIIQGNPLLTAQSAQSLLQLAEDLYTQLSQVSYTPCKVSVPTGLEPEPGQILEVTDSGGNICTAYIMQKTTAGQKDTLECTGAQNRKTTTAVNDRYLKALSGKVLELRTDVDGLYVKNADAAGRAAQVELDLEGLRSRVSRQENDMQKLTQLRQEADSLKLQVQQLSAGTGRVVTSTGYSFTEKGLHISKSGQEMESMVDHTGLYVRRGSQMILQAGNRGVSAVDVTVGNYLVVGSHARFEDFDGGTACFYI